MTEQSLLPCLRGNGGGGRKLIPHSWTQKRIGLLKVKRFYGTVPLRWNASTYTGGHISSYGHVLDSCCSECSSLPFLCQLI